jgi:hypothetical protein
MSDLEQDASELNNRLQRERQSKIVCKVCGFRLDQDPVPPEPGAMFRFTALVNDYPGGPAYEVHSCCMGGKSPVDMSGVIDVNAVDVTDQKALPSHTIG